MVPPLMTTPQLLLAAYITYRDEYLSPATRLPGSKIVQVFSIHIWFKQFNQRVASTSR